MTTADRPKPGITLREKCSSTIKFDELYETDERLRSGSYGTVYTCHHKSTPDRTYAVKILDRTKLKKKDDEGVFREVGIMKELVDVKTVVRLIDFFEAPEKLYVVQVYAAGGDVFDRLAKRTHYNEMESRDLAERLLRTIQALHERNIVHRDLKPENLLLLNEFDDSDILLADFGFARHTQEDGKCTTRCGTPAYVAPEVIIGTPYGNKCDLWSIGCLLYMLTGGYPPFQGKNHRELFRKVRAADFVFHESYWKNVSIESKRLISHLLAVNPETRLNAIDALKSDWFVKSDRENLRSRDLSINLEEIRKFRPRKTWKLAIQAVRFAATAPFWNPDASSFGSQLDKWDKDGEGDETKSQTTSKAHIVAPVRTAKFKEVYDLTKKLRKGSYATVWECMHKETEVVFAVKIIARKNLDPKDDESVLNEVSMMQSLTNNKYVVQLFDFYEERDAFYLVMENMAGGDVFDRIVQMTRYTEKDARDLVTVLLKAVTSMHDVGIAHRDIKPQNLLLRSSEDNADVKVGDFGFARRVHTPESLTSRVGTPSYVAPEVLKNIPHDTRVDLWSIGIVAYVLLVGYPPFMEEDQSVLFQKIRNGDWEFNEADWKDVTQPAKDLVKGLLVVNPKERWSARECLRCEWLKRDANALSQVSLDGSARIIRERKNRLRTIAKAIMWIGKGQKTDLASQTPEVIAEEEGSAAMQP